MLKLILKTVTDPENDLETRRREVTIDQINSMINIFFTQRRYERTAWRETHISHSEHTPQLFKQAINQAENKDEELITIK